MVIARVLEVGMWVISLVAAFCLVCFLFYSLLTTKATHGTNVFANNYFTGQGTAGIRIEDTAGESMIEGNLFIGSDTSAIRIH